MDEVPAHKVIQISSLFSAFLPPISPLQAQETFFYPKLGVKAGM